MKKILKHIKIVNKKSILLPLLVWIVLCLITIFVFYQDLAYMRWIDIPTHFVAGIMLGAISFIISKKNFQKTIILSFIIFIAWEFFEIVAAATSEKEFVINIFSESKSNRIQDIFFDTLGLISFFLIYKRYGLKRKTEYLPES